MESGKRKREFSGAALEALIQGNPKQVLASSQYFEGLTQHQLPIIVLPPGQGRAIDYEARLQISTQKGVVNAAGVSRTRKEAERLCAIDACRQLNAHGVLQCTWTAGGSSISDNPKNSLVRSVPFRALCQGNANKLPISMRRDGPQHSPVFSAELPVPLPGGQEWIASGQGRNKPEAERACCIAAVQRLMAEGLLEPSSTGGGSSEPSKAVTAEQSSDFPPIVVLREADLDRIETVLGRTRADFLETSAAGSRYLNGSLAGMSIAATSVWGSDDNDQELSKSERAGMRIPKIETGNGSASGDVRLGQDAAARHGVLGKSPWEYQESPFRRVTQADQTIDSGGDSGQRQSSFQDERLRAIAEKRRTGSEYAEQRAARAKLPAWHQKEMVLDAVAKSQVVVLTGETGCGKTTQVPQFLLEEQEENGRGTDVHIIITQPRRIAAISVAERVAWERGEPLGQSVGYAIRLESVPPRPRGSLLFCTTGILLRRLQRADGIERVSHIVIDEVHERDVDTDFLLVVVRELLQQNKQLKVIIMSATLEASAFTKYFGGCRSVCIPGFIHPVQVHYLEDLPAIMGPNCPPAVRTPRNSRQGMSEEEDLDIELTASVVVWISQHYAHGDGAVLCFLPGWDSISALQHEFRRMGSAVRNLHIVPLHSQLPSDEQRQAFKRAPPGLRKVVLSTNIAETSVTIDDVVYVIDTGRSKEKNYDPTKDLAIMRVQWTSQASARQRQGRAGRVCPGHCFRLYSRKVHENMAPHGIPEMQRVPLEEVCLSIKAITSAGLANKVRAAPDGQKGLIGPPPVAFSSRGEIEAFLSKAIQPPLMSAVRSAINCLQQLGALDEEQNLLPLGKTLGKLAVHPRLGKMLVYGSLLGCVQPLLTIAAASCSRDPFLCPAAKRAEADAARQRFAVESAVASDQLALARAYEEWAQAMERGQAGYFCDINFLSMAGLRLISGMRQQFERTLADVAPPEHWGLTTDSDTVARLARSVLVAGLYPNVARSEQCKESKSKGGGKPSFRYRFGFKAQGVRVAIHPTSVISEKSLNQAGSYFLAYHEKVQTTQVFVRACTLLPHFAVGLFGGTLRTSRDRVPASMNLPGDWVLLEVDQWLRFAISRRAASLLLEFRRVVDKVMERWVSSKVRTEAEREVLACAIHVLDSTCRDALTG